MKANPDSHVRGLRNGVMMVGLAALGALAGCQSAPPAELTQQMTRTETSIDQAQQGGAQQGALTELQQAKDKQAKAQTALEKKEYEVALRLAQQAQVDAQYAQAKSQAAQAATAAREVQRGISSLRDETGSTPQ